MNISVVGIGKLGLCFALTLEKAGYNVVGVDISQDYVDALNNKTYESYEPGVNDFLEESVNFIATTSLDDALHHSNMIFVVVATPSMSSGRYDHSQVDALVTLLKERGPQQDTKQFVVCCTTMPGYCESIREELAKLNFVVSYNPEFIAQGTILKNQAYPDMVLIGEGSEEAGNMLQQIYEKHTHNEPRICRMSPTEAEITKISLNCFLTTKIAYANMVGDIVMAAGGDPTTVLAAVGEDTRIGSKYLGYGYGYGGPCFPRDNRALAIYAQDLGIDALISKASDESNRKHLDFQVNQFLENQSKEEEVVFDYVTYKPESTLLVESQQLQFAYFLALEGFTVRIKEREEVINELKKRYNDLFIYERRN